MNILDQATSELTEIERQISALNKRREKLRAFVDIGATLYPEAGAITMNGLAPTVVVSTNSGGGTAKSAIIDATREILTSTGSVHTRDLVPKLEARGIKVPGANKTNTVSVILSKSGQFKGSRKHGWSLIGAHKEATPQGALTPAGSGVGSSNAPAEGTGSAAG